MPDHRNGGAQSAGSNGTRGGQTTALATTSERFVAEVERQFAAQLGSGLKWTEYQKTLAQHLFIKVDAQLKALDAIRQEKKPNNTPITWENVNLQKLAIDAVHRVALGLDALMRNHIHPIPYFNSRTKKYDVDLRIGYEGKDYCRRKLAVVEPVEVIYQLVHETDTFVPHVKDQGHEIESYEFTINNPFDRGPVIGGFGYIRYEDPRLNRLVLVTKRDFDRARAAAQSQEFWKRDDLEMMYKTVVHRTTEKIPMDPTKANAPSYAYAEAQEVEGDIEREVAAEANQDFIDVTDYTIGADAQDRAEAPPKDQEPEPAPGTEDKPQREPEPASQATLEGPGF